MSKSTVYSLYQISIRAYDIEFKKINESIDSTVAFNNRHMLENIFHNNDKIKFVVMKEERIDMKQMYYKILIDRLDRKEAKENLGFLEKELNSEKSNI